MGIDTNFKGEVARAAVIKRAAELGVIASTPTTECRYDLILDSGGKLLRTQVKYCDRVDRSGSFIIHLTRKTDSQASRKRTYSAHEVDLIIAYLPTPNKLVVFTPENFSGKTSLSIRESKPSNLQKNRKNIKIISDYEW